MSIVPVIKKDFLVYVRHRKTLLLIFLAPILIMILIGSVFFGASNEGLKGVKLGVGGGSTPGNDIIEELNSSKMFIIVKENTNDPSVIEEGVMKGKYSAGIYIPENQTQSMKLYIDNSRIQIAPVISTVFLGITEKISYELTFGFISNLWEKLGEMESELGPLREGVFSINGNISRLNNDTQNVLARLDEINVTRMNKSINMMKTTLDQMEVDLFLTSVDINTTRNDILELDKNVSSIYNDSASLRDDLKLMIDNIDSTNAALLATQTDLQEIYNSTCAIVSIPQCISITGTIRQIQDTRALLLENTDRIRSLHNDLANVAQKASDLHEKLIYADIRLQSMQVLIGNYIFEISNIQGNISNIQNAIVILDQIKNQSSDVSFQMNKLSTEMENSTSNLVSEINRTKSILGDVRTKSPAAIAAPIKLESEFVFKNMSYLDFLIPAIVSIVLMFISFLLSSITIVQERTKKTLLRTLLTPLSLEKFIFAKTLTLVLIAMFQGVILVAVAYISYGALVPPGQLGLLFLVILVYSAAFIGIGMAVATFAESENTAMLSSLVLSIPMLFLCGVFFPFETMPALMVKVGNALPITMGIKALDSVLIYQEGFSALSEYLLPLLLYGIAGLGMAYILLREEVMD
ncbi:MAG: multidrug ABC transporter permease [Candidatus Methanoperedens nitroreducens]|uniref:Multidrug ABC transporter permease n=1 Tax=Candidatus Methanoperedens nitratireducens TaxID=1392998 RepID=A0A0P8CK16_9EURY|nr:ABC transporter permease [Candidatus Methanoperedens sp. BLZ2]KAB2944239.1 MAG: ABC transporter permease subunit [Candidatus Methanoperedens sp.]KPQ43337.1 MAG: multidrug ABC transporter permease [Candidatus Methanoperedens sp. BLZ1]MBZ0174624.1 ABC transporter permease [Candidatus Methanoperedens nitroreducens]MCX9076916.1 ABC transporter permease [Candidatus Methanoperedens sp.]